MKDILLRRALPAGRLAINSTPPIFQTGSERQSELAEMTKGVNGQ
jgi:hypothetical protein